MQEDTQEAAGMRIDLESLGQVQRMKAEEQMLDLGSRRGTAAMVEDQGKLGGFQQQEVDERMLVLGRHVCSLD